MLAAYYQITQRTLCYPHMERQKKKSLSTFSSISPVSKQPGSKELGKSTFEK